MQIVGHNEPLVTAHSSLFAGVSTPLFHLKGIVLMVASCLQFISLSVTAVAD